MSFNHKEIADVRKALRKYFDTRMSQPFILASDWSLLPHEIQPPFFETCVAYIQEVAEMEDVWTSEMRLNRDIARGMLGMD